MSPARITALLLAAFVLSTTARAESRSESVTSCSPESAMTKDFEWIDALAADIERKTEPKPEPKKEELPPSPEPRKKEEKKIEPEEKTERDVASTLDLPKATLARLANASHAAARECRRREGRRICGEDRGKGLCFRAVKEALQRARVVDRYLIGAYARQAHQGGILRRAGFTNLLGRGDFDSSNAPLGAILVYSGGRKGYGHIEIKLGKRDYCSDFCSTVPMDRGASYARKLIGIYVKPTRE